MTLFSDKKLGIKTEEIQLDGKDTYYNHRYEPTPYSVLDTLFNYLEDTEILAAIHNSTTVDCGCGSGRLSFYMAERFNNTNIGIELQEKFYNKALKNLKKRPEDKITFLNISITDYSISKSDCIFYFFNPFSIEIFKSFVNKIIISQENCPRNIYFLLYYPLDDYIFFLEQHTDFTLFDELAAFENISKDRREKLCVYKLSKH